MSSTTTETTTRNEPSSSIPLKGLSSVKGTLSYLDRSVKDPFIYVEPPTDGPRNNHAYETIEVDIHDVSSISSEERARLGLTTDGAGFEIVDGWGSDSSDVAAQWVDRKWEEEGWLEKEYYKDVDALLKRHQGATSTFIFDHTIRKRHVGDKADLVEGPLNRQPVAQVHSDQSRWAGENRVRKHLGEELLERVKKGEVRAQIINVWRPLRGIALDHPLAFGDSRTVQPGDWIVNELRYPEWTGQTLAIYSNPDHHKWYYYRGLPTDKAVLLKCYDSESETRTPHTAFDDLTVPKDAEPRWSVEIRALVITDPKAKA